MSSIRSLAAAVPTLALLLGCMPLERGHDPAPSTEGSGGGGAEGNPPLQCKLCLLSKTGCGAAWDACMSEDGAAGGGGVGASDGGNCACDPALPLCPGGGTCAAPGGFTLPGNESCGLAQYCAPCCDPADPCAAVGTCEVTRIAQEPCSNDYECCSGVCNGICQAAAEPCCLSRGEVQRSRSSPLHSIVGQRQLRTTPMGDMNP